MASTRSHGREIVYDVQGHGSPVLLICGSLSDRSVWHTAGYVERLMTDFTVITMDPLGHGESERSHDEADYAGDRLIDHALAVLDAEQIDRASIWGYSRGGSIAASIAWRSPERVKTVVLGGTPMIEGSSWSAEALDALGRGDWDACWASFPVPMPEDARARIEAGNDPQAVAAALRAGRAEPFLWRSFDGSAIAYVGDGEGFVDANRSKGAEIGLPVAVLPTGSHVATFDASEIVIGVVGPFL